MRGGLFVFALCATSTGLFGQQTDSSTTRAVVPGVTHRRIVINSGPFRINVLEVDLRQPGVVIRAVRANDKFFGRETVSSMVQRYAGPGRVAGAINGDFFHIRAESENENNLIIEGALIKGVRFTDSPYDRFDAVHSQFAVDSANHPFIDRFMFAGEAILSRSRSIRIDRLNSIPPANGLVLYTSAFGDSEPRDSIGRHPLSLPLERVGQRGDTLIFRVAGGLTTNDPVSLRRGAALAAEGISRADLREIARSGRAVRIVVGLVPVRARLRTVMGGWPRLINHGKSVLDSAERLEGTTPSFSRDRHPRTAIGFSRDSTRLFLVTVDGRSESASGMSLPELTKFMLDLGVYEGMNFDGGGSTAMVVDGKLINSPSDKTGERKVGSGLLVIVPNLR
ncbi:MAG TPA: phosphodiester glycosidase family protein [Gemmatimonadaceae bacterium]|nr:phosphodiester glycosidase family protein [Gemmatimonadaceae bacterium]